MTIGVDNDMREEDEKEKNKTKAKRDDKIIMSRRKDKEFN